MSTETKLLIVLVGLVGVIAQVALLIPNNAVVSKLGGSTPGIPAKMASSTSISVGPSVNGITLFDTSATSSCSARFISTQSQPINLYFATDTINDLVTPFETRGFQQAASTTVVYDAATWGCGKVKAFGFTSTTTITTGRSE